MTARQHRTFNIVAYYLAVSAHRRRRRPPIRISGLLMDYDSLSEIEHRGAIGRHASQLIVLILQE